MPASKTTATEIMKLLLDGGAPEECIKRLDRQMPDEKPLPPRVPLGNDHSEKGLARRRAFMRERGFAVDHLGGELPEEPPETLSGNIENMIGHARLPVGVIGPLRIQGAYAQGDFYVPMATSEGALVASYNRGAYVISQSGGASVMCLTESVSRSPCFVFSSMAQSGLFLAWVLPRIQEFQRVVDTTSRHCRLLDMRTSFMGKEVYLIFDFSTGDAAGQNMVTLATEALCHHLVEAAPVKPVNWYVEGNLSGDKKSTMLSFLFARGKKVVAEAVIRADLLQRVIRVDPASMVRGWQISVLGGMQSGSIGSQAHVANALAALFIACGQDAACVAEASIGMTRMDITDAGDLFISLSLPNLIVGTVGGGTHLPTARECLDMIGCRGENGARKFAEICAVTALAGEISLTGAIIAGDFASAHANYGRKKRPLPDNPGNGEVAS